MLRLTIVVKERPRFVSRAGDKLDAALDTFAVDVTGASVLDVGASTGGFVDCVLQRGATRVIALDVGRGQLDSKLRGDPRVHVIEGVNARYLEPGSLPWQPDLLTMDVSFISVTKVLPAVVGCMAPEFTGVILIKPQFEAGPRDVGKGGIVRDVGCASPGAARDRRVRPRRTGRGISSGCAGLRCRVPAATWSTSSTYSEVEQRGSHLIRWRSAIDAAVAGEAPAGGGGER